MKPAPTRTPLVVTLLGVVALIIIIGPVLALGIRVPWTRFIDVLTDPTTTELLRITFASAVWATVLTTLLGVPLALLIQAWRRGGRIIRLLVMLPLAMPPVVAGLALTAAIGRRGVTAPLLDALGLQFAFAFPGVVLSHLFIALPFVVVTVDSAMRQIDPEIPASAAGLGMRPGKILTQVTLPAIAPAIATGAGLAFARSLGEFGTTLTFAGSMPGLTRTMPLGIYLERETDPGSANALGAILIILAVIVLVIAAIPAALKRTPRPQARATLELNTEKLRSLTAPSGDGVDVEIDGTRFPARRISAIVGPNGSGKTTLMSVLAGRLQGSTIRIGLQKVDGPGTRFIPPSDRGVVLLTQRPGLPRTATVEKAISMVTRDRLLTHELLDAAGLTPLMHVPVPNLSGGQAAQVALVRALATRPQVLILDEPLSAVDVESATRWRRLLRAAASDRTTLLVTHDPLDVAVLSVYLVLLEGGTVHSAGPTTALLEVPPTDFLAELAGLARILGTVTGQEVDTATLHSEELIVTGTISTEADEPLCNGDIAVATFSPESITIRLPDPRREVRESARNIWQGVVESVGASASRSGTVVTVAVGAAQLAIPATRRSVIELRLEPGMIVDCVIKATAIRVHGLKQRNEEKNNDDS